MSYTPTSPDGKLSVEEIEAGWHYCASSNFFLLKFGEPPCKCAESKTPSSSLPKETSE